eukprot:CAMPEP_0113819328 /NCGR_PEP_ID=MMETSP0328-20130328/684_1 /TAXON_ID=39455 /ORGANISM="Alexandrium minutum" /LENGTH=393 /DNA_ID=CAMNT_0000787261 /DNA_START=85 /DNA_END=1263 /DNA_ORIENTATION=- /assembly_acc=CAM_ASM_000350
MLLGIVFAILSGTCGTLAAIAVSLPVHYAKADNKELSASKHAASVTANLVATGAGVVLGILACSQGPVSIIFPLSVAAGLTSNMVLQGGLCLAKYTNVSIVGTLVLVFAVVLLRDLGAPPLKTESQGEVLGMMVKPQAIAFIAISLSVNVACLTALYFRKVTGNMAMLFAFALVGGTGTVLNTSIQKLLSMAIPFAGKCLLGLVWVALSCVCLGSGAMANGSLEDPSKFVPISNGVNLVLNCFAGLCIWGDGPRLSHPTSYAIVYVLVVLGTYLVSSIDIFSVVHLQVRQAVYDHTQKGIKRGLTKSMARDPALMQVLTRTDSEVKHACVQLQQWPHLKAAVHLVGTHNLPDFEKRLVKELDKQMVSHAEVASLCSMLLERLGGKDGEGQECW